LLPNRGFHRLRQSPRPGKGNGCWMIVGFSFQGGMDIHMLPTVLLMMDGPKLLAFTS